jgi:hypothetical protein
MAFEQVGQLQTSAIVLLSMAFIESMNFTGWRQWFCMDRQAELKGLFLRHIRFQCSAPGLLCNFARSLT